MRGVEELPAAPSGAPSLLSLGDREQANVPGFPAVFERYLGGIVLRHAAPQARHQVRSEQSAEVYCSEQYKRASTFQKDRTKTRIVDGTILSLRWRFSCIAYCNTLVLLTAIRPPQALG